MRNATEISSEIAQLAETCLDLKRWGFQEEVRLGEAGSHSVPIVIYASGICKIKISFAEWHPPHQSKEYTIDVHYGRPSAPNNEITTIYKDEECYCWHGVVKVLHFIDRSTPEYVTKNLLSHKCIEQYRTIVSSIDLAHRLPEWEIRKHAYIWDRYAPRLFEVFDLQRSELWEQYRQFLKEVYDIKGRSPLITPPLDKVC